MKQLVRSESFLKQGIFYFVLESFFVFFIKKMIILQKFK
ncbi:hypothetical protein RU98_GL001715 [Enterococcus caccae]|nr:hypothetical protein RU98_GL001715 [Enterococcus caccae]